jgi:predicted nucleotidyltransferase component of viral defense system
MIELGVSENNRFNFGNWLFLKNGTGFVSINRFSQDLDFEQPYHYNMVKGLILQLFDISETSITSSSMRKSWKFKNETIILVQNEKRNFSCSKIQ